MIVRQARMIFSAYRRDDFADPDGFVLQLGMILERYSDEVVIEVSHPLSGIQRRHKGRPPDIAAIVEACDEIAARIERYARFSAMKLNTDRAPRTKEHKANVFVPAGNARYAAMLEKAKTASREEWRYDTERPGIWVALGWLDEQQATTAKGWRSFTGDELMAMYGLPAYPPSEPAEPPAAGAAAQ